MRASERVWRELDLNVLGRPCRGSGEWPHWDSRMPHGGCLGSFLDKFEMPKDGGSHRGLIGILMAIGEEDEVAIGQGGFLAGTQ